MPDIEVDLERCNGCGKCRDICPKVVFEPTKIKDQIKYLPNSANSCLFCCTCVGVCSKNAITIKKKNFKNSFFKKKLNYLIE